jgi:hypothetical protein
MNRTEPDLQRRRVLADAASGFPERTRVVLYACVPDVRDPAKVMSGLRAHAGARDWVVAGEFHDQCPPTTPRTDRNEWPKVERLIKKGDAEGSVAPAETQIAYYPPAQNELRDWMLGLRAFAVYIWQPDDREAPMMEEATG